MDLNSSEIGRILYNIDGSDFTEDIPMAIAKGTYTVGYRVDGDSNHNAADAEYITAGIGKKARKNISISMQDYGYAQTAEVPAPQLNVPAGEEQPAATDVTYYYNTTGSNNGGDKWENIKADTLDAGTYYMYAEIAESEDWLPFLTEAVEFNISKAKAEVIKTPTGGVEYGGKISDITLAGGETSTSGTFVWDDSVKDIQPEVSDSCVTEYKVHFIPDDQNNYDPTYCNVRVTVVAKRVTESDVVVVADDEGNVKEVFLQDGTKLKEGTDYKYTVNRKEDSDVVEAVIELIGNYSGTVKKNFTVPLGTGNIKTSVVVDESVKAMSPKIEEIKEDDAKKIFLDNLKGSEYLEKVKKGEEVSYNAVIYLEMTELEEAQVTDEDSKIADEYKEKIGGTDCKPIFFDLSLFMKYTISDAQTGKILEEKVKERITDSKGVKEIVEIEVPNALRCSDPNKTRYYVILRIHDEGNKKTKDILWNAPGTNIKIESDKFSTYVLMYYDKNNEAKPTPAPDNGGSGSSSSNNNIQVIPVAAAQTPVAYVSPKTSDTNEVIVLAFVFAAGIILLFAEMHKRRS